MKYFKKQDLEFDIERLQNETNELLSQVDWKQWAGQGICMTQVPGDPSSVDDDKLKGLYYTKPDSTGEEVTRENSIDESKYTVFRKEFCGMYFEEIHSELSKRWTIGRMRLFLIEPRTCLSWHRDPEPRLNIAITTNYGSFLVIEDEQFIIPTDGSVWFTDTTNYHTSYNGGEENKISLITTCIGKHNVKTKL